MSRDNARVKPLKFAALPAFLRSSPIVVVYVAAGGLGVPNNTLVRKLHDEYHPRIAFGSINKTEFDGLGAFGRAYVGRILGQIGLPPQVLPGYYLFHNGDLLGWHPGAFDEDTSRVVKGVGVAYALFQLYRGKGLAGSALSGWRLYESGPASAAFSFFQERVREAARGRPERGAGEQQRDRESHRADQRRVYQTALERAYSVFELDASATDAELKAQRRKLFREHHPDKTDDEEERARRDEFTKVLNNAWDLIAAEREL